MRDATAEFIEAASDGRALNKHGRPYNESSWRDIEECLTKHVVPRLGPRRLGEIKRLDIRLLIDDLGPRLSGSRVRSIVNAIRSLYRWGPRNGERGPGGESASAGCDGEPGVAPSGLGSAFSPELALRR